MQAPSGMPHVAAAGPQGEPIAALTRRKTTWSQHPQQRVPLICSAHKQRSFHAPIQFFKHIFDEPPAPCVTPFGTLEASLAKGKITRLGIVLVNVELPSVPLSVPTPRRHHRATRVALVRHVRKHRSHGCWRASAISGTPSAPIRLAPVRVVIHFESITRSIHSHPIVLKRARSVQRTTFCVSQIDKSMLLRVV